MASHPSLAALADKIEVEIRKGKIAPAQERLDALDRADIPRDEAVRFASLARRAGQPSLGARWLRPLVRPAGRRANTATPEEIVEYAACLTRLGVVGEARGLLAGVDAKVCPRVAFEMGAALVAEWRYAESIPHFREYARRDDTPTYERAVAKANLAAAFVHEHEFQKATLLLRELLHDASLKGNSLLLGNAFQLSALCLAARRKFTEAENFLGKAESYLSRPLEAFLLHKWKAVFGVLRKGEAAAAALVEVSEEARRQGFWESWRDCDRLLAIHAGDATRFSRVYYGTPFDSYRKRLVEETPRPPKVTPFYEWESGEAKPKEWLDLVKGIGRGGTLEKNPMLHRALLALASDFYHPLRVATLFSRLHPDEHYHPESSSARIHQTVRTLRRWLVEHAPGVHVDESGGDYVMRVSADWGVRVPLEKALLESDVLWVRLRELQALFGNETFDSKTAADRTGTSVRTVLRLLSFGVEEKRLERTGKTSRIRYRFFT